MSRSKTTPLKAPTRIGTPHRMIATQAISSGRMPFRVPVILRTRETAEVTAQISVSFGSFSSHLFSMVSSLTGIHIACIISSLQNTMYGFIISVSVAGFKNQKT